jgi:hypothetical protein
MFYIKDDRYLTSTLEVANAADDDAAEGVARRFLATSAHHLGVDVWDDDRFVVRVMKD